ncbi:hypothetical protein D3C72_1374480 [compost metagenome]
MRQRQEHGGRQDLAGLHALQGEAREEAAAPERCVLQDHRACARDFAGHGEALHQAQEHQQRRGQQADLVVGRQQAHGHGREAHQEHAQHQHLLAPVRVAPVAEHEGADGARDIAHAVGRERRDDGRGRVALGEEDLRKDQRRGGGVDEEVVVLQRRADPAAGGGFPRLVLALRLSGGWVGHGLSPVV